MQIKLFHLLALISVFATSIHAQSYEVQYQKCSEAFITPGAEIDSVYWVRLRERDSCLAGSVAPDFSATSVDGKTIELSKLRGQVVVLNFWFTKCQPCMEEMPSLNELVEHYAGEKVQFISFAQDDSSAVLSFLQEHLFAFTAIAKADSIRRYKFRLFSTWPYTVIIDKEGRISKMWSGNPGHTVYDYYRQIIDKLL